MQEGDSRKLDHQTLETLRLRAVEQVARGVPAAEVGAGLAVLGLRCGPRRCPVGRARSPTRRCGSWPR